MITLTIGLFVEKKEDDDPFEGESLVLKTKRENRWRSINLAEA
jgi:hypothetical protein